jgi:glycosyltransferase involved in cell wall biosynthesis
MVRQSLDNMAIVRLVLDCAEIGGAILDVDALDRALTRRHSGLEIHRLYFTLAHGRPRSVFIGESAIHYHPISYSRNCPSAEFARLLGILREEFISLVDRYKPELFVSHVPEQPSGLILSQLARARRIPVMALFHGGNRAPIMESDAQARAFDAAAANLRASSGFADVMAAVSDSAGGVLQMTPVLNLGTGADPAFFDPRRAQPGYLRERLGLPRSLPVFLLSARIVPEKGHKILLDASDILHDRLLDHRVVFAGSATDAVRHEVETYIAQNGFSGVAHLIYDATQEEMVSIYRDADVIVLPTFHFEGCPRCLIEAGLMEKPVVATDSGGTREAFVPGETGYLVPPGDARALADVLDVLVRDPVRRRLMGEAGRKFTIRRFDLDALAQRHEAVYADLVGRRARIVA